MVIFKSKYTTTRTTRYGVLEFNRSFLPVGSAIPTEQYEWKIDFYNNYPGEMLVTKTANAIVTKDELNRRMDMSTGLDIPPLTEKEAQLYTSRQIKLSTRPVIVECVYENYVAGDSTSKFQAFGLGVFGTLFDVLNNPNVLFYHEYAPAERWVAMIFNGVDFVESPTLTVNIGDTMKIVSSLSEISFYVNKNLVWVSSQYIPTTNMRSGICLFVSNTGFTIPLSHSIKGSVYQ